jgi:hypothetical protein
VLGISLGLSWAMAIGNFDITPFSKKKRKRKSSESQNMLKKNSDVMK